MNSGYGSRLETVRSRRCAGVTACLLLLFCGALSAQNPNFISTVAGGASVNGPATGPNADIPGPSSVALDSNGNLYIAAPSAQQVYLVDPTGTTLSVFAGLGWTMTNPKSLDGKPATSGSLFNPSGVAVGAAGNIYIADAGNNLIRQVNTKGIMTTLAGTGVVCPTPTSACGDNGPAASAQFNNPSSVATDKGGNVYIADTGDNRVRAINLQASAITIAGVTIQSGQIATIIGTGAVCISPTAKCGDTGKAINATLNAPQGVVAAFGYVGVSDTGDHRVRAATPQGTMVAYAGNGNLCVPSVGCGDGGPAAKANLSTPVQLYVDTKENLYVTDAGANQVREIPVSAKISTIAGTGTPCFIVGTPFCGDTGPATQAFLNSPRGIVLDSTGNVYIGDSGTQRIRKITTQVINTYAGGGNGNDSQAATSAILAGDRDVATDSLGNVYIADSGNNRIRMISGGNISTVAGTGLAAYSGNGKAATAAGLNSPYGVWVDANNNIFIADTLNLVIRKIGPAGTITTVAGNGQVCVPTSQCGDGGPAQSASLTLPTKVTTDGNGNFYIADPPTNRVRMVDSAGNISTIAGTGVACTNPAPGSCGDGGPAVSALLNQPYSVAVDGTGNIYIADMGDNRIRMIDTSGNMQAYAFNGQTQFGPNSIAALQSSFSTPEYMALDSRANMFVSGSTLYYVIQRIDAPTATVMSVAGKYGNPTTYGFSGDGTAALGAVLNNAGVAVDSSENLYIAELGSNRVRTVNILPTADLSTVTLTFPPTPIGVPSQPVPFTDKDTGSDDLVYSNTTISGPFTYVNPMPCTETAPSLKCQWEVVFTPTGYGAESGKANIYDNAFDYPDQLLYLSGSGPDFTITANPTTLTINPGSQGSSTITLTPEAGFNLTVNLTCTGAPSGTTCVPNPNQLTLDGTDAANSTLGVTVGTSTQAGTYTLTVKGASVTTHTTTVKLTVP
jgi:trimeric autotransporter adhesin